MYLTAVFVCAKLMILIRYIGWSAPVGAARIHVSINYISRIEFLTLTYRESVQLW